jgi:hypothetical protein
MCIPARMILSSFCLLVLTTWAQGQTTASSPRALTDNQRARIVEDFGKLPLAFEANEGQSDSQVKFLARGAGYSLFLTPTGAVLTLQPSAGSAQRSTGAVLRMKLLHADPKAIVAGEDELPGKSNYFIGKDPTKWHPDVRRYARVRYSGAYPGVDLVYYGNQRELEYDFVLQPGADPELIRIGIEGTSTRRVERGDLVLTTAAGEVRLRSPHIFEQRNGTQHDVRGGFVMKNDNEVGFEIAAYDRGRTLIIDPVLAYSTYLGGTGDEAPGAIAVDRAGNAYVIGWTTSPDFPTWDPVGGDFHGGYPYGDAFVSKINSDGSALIYSTYLGGNSDDVGRDIAVDASGNAYVIGYVQSSDFPIVNAFQPVLHGWRNAFVAKIDAAGNGLVYSTYLGGGEEDGHGIAVDALGRAHVRGDTRSRDFPVYRAIQPYLRSQYLFNCFVSELNADGNALVYSTYWGGSVGEAGVGIAVDAAGNTYVGGSTFSPDFPTVNPIQAVLAGQSDAFITKFSPDGQAVVYSTFLGGTGTDQQLGTSADAVGNGYIVGSTDSTDFPTLNALQPANRGGTDAFVAKVNPAGNALVYSTYLGGSADDVALGIAVDSRHYAYVVGRTTSADFPALRAIQATNRGGQDVFLTTLSPKGNRIDYSTYLGGTANEGDYQVAVAIDSRKSAYVMGATASLDFPTTPSALQKSPQGGLDTFVVKIENHKRTH